MGMRMGGRINGDDDDGSLPSVRRGAWTVQEDQKLEQCVEMYGSKKWKSLAVKAGLNRCGKSCRLRWLNYLQPGIKRGNMSDAEEDLILRLHRLLGNRWSLISRRIPGRTDNEIKNYWNTHLRKKAKLMEKLPVSCFAVVQHNRQHEKCCAVLEMEDETETCAADDQQLSLGLGDDDMFDISGEGVTYGLEWVRDFLQLEHETSQKTTY